MDRQKAITVIKQLTAICELPNETSIMLMTPSRKPDSSEDYQVHIKTILDLRARLCISAVSDQHQLKTDEKNQNIVISDRKNLV